MSGRAGAGRRARPSSPYVLGVRVDAVSKSFVLAEIARAVTTETPLSITFLNPNYLMKAVRDVELRDLINEFDLVLADGWGIVAGARFLGVAVPTRLATDDLGADVFSLSEGGRWRTFLFGSAPGVAEAASATIRDAYPRLPVVGTRHGWWDVVRGHPGRFDEQDELETVSVVNSSGAQVLWVGVPTPLQQRWVGRHRDRIDAAVVITGGAYLDHLVDRIDYYPRWILRLRLCWLYKFVREPRRVWRRYSVEMIQFAVLLVRARWSQR